MAAIERGVLALVAIKNGKSACGHRSVALVMKESKGINESLAKTRCLSSAYGVRWPTLFANVRERSDGSAVLLFRWFVADSVRQMCDLKPRRSRLPWDC